jgi:hypothetical protein
MSMRLLGRLMLMLMAGLLTYAFGGPAFAQDVIAAAASPSVRASNTLSIKPRVASPTVRLRIATDTSEPSVMQRLAAARCELDDEQDARSVSAAVTLRTPSAHQGGDCASQRLLSRF